MRICLKNEYCINISVGRVYRLMKSMSLPKMSTVKPFIHKFKSVSDEPCKNILKQEFNQSEPNIVWVCDFTYIRAGGRFYYLCAILDLFSRKVIAYKFFTYNVRIAFSTAITITPTSAKIAPHMLAIPKAPRIKQITLIPMAK